jgi:hypothetical protein
MNFGSVRRCSGTWMYGPMNSTRSSHFPCVFASMDTHLRVCPENTPVDTTWDLSKATPGGPIC